MLKLFLYLKNKVIKKEKEFNKIINEVNISDLPNVVKDNILKKKDIKKKVKTIWFENRYIYIKKKREKCKNFKFTRKDNKKLFMFFKDKQKDLIELLEIEIDIFESLILEIKDYNNKKYLFDKQFMLEENSFLDDDFFKNYDDILCKKKCNDELLTNEKNKYISNIDEEIDYSDFSFT